MSNGPAAELRVEGDRELSAALNGIEDGLKDLTPLNSKVASVVASSARRLAPRLTGRLEGSITGQGTGEGAEVGSPIAYGWPVHSGVPARGIAGVPFIADAWRDTEPAWMAIYDNGVQDLIDREVSSKAMH